MSWNDHDHRREYAETSHTHSFWDLNDVAEKHHRHYDLERDGESARHGVDELRAEVRDLRGQLDEALDRIGGLEKQTPQAQRLQLEADQAAADLAESGYDRHGRDCQCPFCFYDPAEDEIPGPEMTEPCVETSDGRHTAGWYDGGRCGACGLFGPEPDDEPEPEEHDPGQEVDDEGGMSEYRYILAEDYQRGQS